MFSLRTVLRSSGNTAFPMYHYFGTVYALKAQRTGTIPFQSERERSDGPLAFPTGTVQRTANVPDI